MKILFLKHKNLNAWDEFQDEIGLFGQWLAKHEVPYIFEFQDWDDELQWQKYGDFYALSPEFMQSLGSKAWWEPGEYHVIFYCYYPEKENSSGVFFTMGGFKCNGGIGSTIPLSKEIATLPTQWGWRCLSHEFTHQCFNIINLIYKKNIPDTLDQLCEEAKKNGASEEELTGITDLVFERDIKPHLNLITQPLPDKKKGEIMYQIIALLNSVVALLKSLIQAKEDRSKVIKKLADAIAYFEGFFLYKSLPRRLNNPGALVYVGQKNSVRDESGFACFLTAEDGWNALYRQLDLILSGKTRYYLPDMTIQEFVDVWASTSPEIERINYARYIADKFGVEVDTPLNQLK